MGTISNFYTEYSDFFLRKIRISTDFIKNKKSILYIRIFKFENDLTDIDIERKI